MAFVGIYRALYNYAPQGENELTISEGDLLYVLEKSSEDDWWKAKKKASGDEEEEPVGLIPNNYVEEAHPTQHARALYDYTRQTDEELSFSEDAQLEVFDTSDPDWILVGLDGEYGFAPANYIDVTDDAPTHPIEAAAVTITAPAQSQKEESSTSEERAHSESRRQDQSPAAALAGIMNQRASTSTSRPPAIALPPRPQYTPEASDEEEQSTPSLPARPQSQTMSSHSIDSPPLHEPGIAASPPHNRVARRSTHEDVTHDIPGGFHMYNINEMVSVMGKRKKMPTTLGINLATGTIMISPEKARDGPSQEWTAEKMSHYSIEGKHVFLELVRPSKSVDFHAGSKDTAEEIVAALGEMAGAVRAEGLREVIMAGSGQAQRRGLVLYDFMAQGDDEVTVAVNDEVIILDDTKSDEWWQVRRVKNGKEGVVPSSYVEVSSTVAPPGSSRLNAGRSTVEQNRLEEQRLAKEAVKDTSRSEVGPGMRLPERGSSLSARDVHDQQKGKRDNRASDSGQSRASKSKPDPSKVRTWTDRSKSFSVEAQFLALKDGKINLHKMNGVKIAVPVAKMSVEDLEYVERITGVSLDEDKPLSNIKKQQDREKENSNTSKPKVGVTIEHQKKPEYDWFQFFLSCDVTVGLCERYAQTFNKDSMDESVLPDVDATVLRRLGLREGDIIKVMRYLDNKYGRKRHAAHSGLESGENDGDPSSAGSLFSGPGGALRNNTRSRPVPAIQASNVIDPKAFSQSNATPPKPTPERIQSPESSAPTPVPKDTPAGFEDDAWDVKPIIQKPQSGKPPSPKQSTTIQQSQPPPQTLSGSMQDLTLLTQPLEPIKVQPPAPSQQPQPVQQPQQQQSQQQPQSKPLQPSGATPSFFAGVNQQPSGLQAQASNGSFMQNPQLVAPQISYGQQPLQQNIARQRPVVPQFTQGQGSLMPPPPPRPLSAPQTTQQNTFGPPPLLPQMTGIPNSAFQSTQLAPPGQSLAEINQMRMQQQYVQQQQQVQQQMAGFGGQPSNMMPQATGVAQFQAAGQQQNGFSQPMQAQSTGFQPAQPFMNGQMVGGPFLGPSVQQFSPVQSQPTGFPGTFNSPQQLPQQYPQPAGINSILPPPLQPQKTAMQPQPTVINGFGQGFQPPPVPPIPPQQTIPPLLLQKTGPPPPVRFGVHGDAKKLVPQVTGRRANLAQATPQNPFGF